MQRMSIYIYQKDNWPHFTWNTDLIISLLSEARNLQGRLIGKRFHARFFLESDFGDTHACNYLLADDIENEPVPGYSAANWESGYGDFVMRPDMSTLRNVAWLEGTVMVLCDVLDHDTHQPVPHSPRAILKRQIARRRLQKSVMCRPASSPKAWSWNGMIFIYWRFYRLRAAWISDLFVF